MMATKTKSELSKELSRAERDAENLRSELALCKAKAEDRAKGWKVIVNYQTLSGSFESLQKTAKQLIDAGLWFLELRKVG